MYLKQLYSKILDLGVWSHLTMSARRTPCHQATCHANVFSWIRMLNKFSPSEGFSLRNNGSYTEHWHQGRPLCIKFEYVKRALMILMSIINGPLKNSHYISNWYFQDKLFGTYDSWVMKARPETKTGDIHCKSGKGKYNSKENIKPNKTLVVICTIRIINYVPEHNIITLNIY